jgi:diguanylate cyclase (GGDEF)-like protein
LIGTQFLSAAELKISVTGSFGLATFPEDGDTLHAIIRSADTMMYHAKAEGRNRVAVADPERLRKLPASKTSRHE